jgi:hypothetical protein
MVIGASANAAASSKRNEVFGLGVGVGVDLGPDRSCGGTSCAASQSARVSDATTCPDVSRAVGAMSTASVPQQTGLGVCTAGADEVLGVEHPESATPGPNRLGVSGRSRLLLPASAAPGAARRAGTA